MLGWSEGCAGKTAGGPTLLYCDNSGVHVTTIDHTQTAGYGHMPPNESLESTHLRLQAETARTRMTIQTPLIDTLDHTRKRRGTHTETLVHTQRDTLHQTHTCDSHGYSNTHMHNDMLARTHMAAHPISRLHNGQGGLAQPSAAAHTVTDTARTDAHARWLSAPICFCSLMPLDYLPSPTSITILTSQPVICSR